jgi:hypothetical protein
LNTAAWKAPVIEGNGFFQKIRLGKFEIFRLAPLM